MKYTIKRNSISLFVLFGLLGGLQLGADASAMDRASQSRILESHMLEAQGLIAQAIERLIPLLQTDPNNYYLNLRLGWLFSQNKKYKNALDHYETAAKLEAKSVEPLLGMSLGLIAAGDYARAAEKCREILRRDPLNYLGRQRLIQTMIKLNQYDSAVSEAALALKGYPADAVFLEQQGFALKQLGKNDEAQQVLGQLLLVNPKNAYARAILGSSY